MTEIQSGQNGWGNRAFVQAAQMAGMDPASKVFQDAWGALPFDQRAALLDELRQSSHGSGPLGMLDAEESQFTNIKGKIAQALKTAQKNTKAKADQDQAISDTRGEIDKFYKMLSSPLQRPDGTYSDPLAQQLVNAGASGSSHRMGQSGISGSNGGYSEAAGRASVFNALAPYQSTRLNLQQQALSLKNNSNISLGQLQQGQQGLDMQRTQMENAAAQQRAAAAAAQNQAGMGLVGGLLGLGASAVSGGAIPPGLAFSTGSSLGGAVGGISSPSATSSSYTGGGYGG
jgi:hypothetical protein